MTMYIVATSPDLRDASWKDTGIINPSYFWLEEDLDRAEEWAQVKNNYEDGPWKVYAFQVEPKHPT
jgi:hypothetical protein